MRRFARALACRALAAPARRPAGNQALAEGPPDLAPGRSAAQAKHHPATEPPSQARVHGAARAALGRPARGMPKQAHS